MPADTDQTPSQSAAKVAGFFFLFTFIVPTFNWVLLLSAPIVSGDVIATAENVLADELRFRVGLTIELVMAFSLVLLALALYAILETVDRALALLALTLKLIEAALVAAIVLLSFVALQLASGDAPIAGLTPGQLRVLLGVLLDKHTALYAIPMVFLGLDMVLFFCLFYRSRYIPRALSAFGIVAFALILVHAVGYLVAPELAAMVVSQVVGYTPSAIVEIVVGLWLLAKGLDTSQAAASS